MSIQIIMGTLIRREETRAVETLRKRQRNTSMRMEMGVGRAGRLCKVIGLTAGTRSVDHRNVDL